MKKTITIILLAIMVLLSSCDGGILSDIVSSTPKTSISYKQILHVDPTEKFVYCLDDTGIWKAKKKGEGKKQLVRNGSGQIVQSAAWFEAGSQKGILYTDGSFKTDKLKYVSSDGETTATYTLTKVDDEKKRIHSLYTNGMVCIKTVGKEEYTFVSGLSLSGTELTAANELTLSFPEYGLSTVALATGTETDEKADFLVTFAKPAPSAYTMVLVRGLSEGPVKAYTSSTTLRSPVANFIKDQDGKISVFTESGEVYHCTLNESEKTLTPTKAFSTVPGFGRNAFIYYAGRYSSDSKEYDYVITKNEGQSSGLHVYSFEPESTSLIDNGTVNQGYGKYLTSDSITCVYKLDDDAENHRLLVGTNESGMCTITLKKNSSVGENSESNGSSTKFEKYNF